MKDLLLGIIGFIALLFITVVIVALPVMLLWNCLMPVILGLPHINFLQALGLTLLVHFLFSSSTIKAVKQEDNKLIE